MLAAIPALLGFYPAESLVVATLKESEGQLEVGLMARTDLPCPSEYQNFATGLLTGPLGRCRLDRAMLFVVTEGTGTCTATSCRSCTHNTGSQPPASDQQLPHAELITILQTLLGAARIATYSMYVPTIAAGQRWQHYDDPHSTGTVPDPKSSAVAAAMAMQGSVTFGSREEIAALIAPDIDEVARFTERLEVLLNESVEDISEVEGLRIVLGAVDRIAAGQALTDEELLRVQVAVADTEVRDLAMSTAVGDSAGAAEQLWMLLARKAPAPEVAEPLALLAVSAFLRGEGGLVRAALTRIAEDAPEHMLGWMLQTATDAGLDPREVLRPTVREAALKAEQLLTGAPPVNP
ncbi:DUF4192 domain-containing protein [Saccharopolyspora indica]|nr:DUF4192 domain-containing protein [Saccharopolyspora indica]MDA3644379.1 DUF4192 domain-containing protein [Saccharopolyspora indica]